MVDPRHMIFSNSLSSQSLRKVRSARCEDGGLVGRNATHGSFPTGESYWSIGGARKSAWTLVPVKEKIGKRRPGRGPGLFRKGGLSACGAPQNSRPGRTMP